MEVRRTVPVKLDVSKKTGALLEETIDEYLWAANYVISAAWDGEWAELRKCVLHERTYSVIRDVTRLHSNHVQSARNRAIKALKSVVGKWKNGEFASLPTISSRFIDYNQRNATFLENQARLSTVDGRVSVRFVLPEEVNGTPQARYLLSDSWEITGATLHNRDDGFHLHVRTKADVDVSEPAENGTVLGVDLGIENIAVTSTGEFWSADELNHWRREYAHRRTSLQKCGSRHAHNIIQRLGRKETARCTHYLHRVANGLVEEATDRNCAYIAFEDLTGIRDRIGTARKFHEWAFNRLFEFVKYKAEERGIAVEQVNPRFTSQRCSTCGFTMSENRQSQETFSCKKCGYENHADYNAAKNIGLNLLHRHQNGDGGGAPVGVRLNTGAMTTNGITAVPESARVEAHGEPH